MERGPVFRACGGRPPRDVESVLMEDIPRRNLLVSQTVCHLRSRILSGYWVGRLPAERLLSGQLQVSRNTVRAALGQLQREGLTRSLHGSGTEIVGPTRRRGARMASRDAAILTPQPLDQLQPRQARRRSRHQSGR